MTRTQAYESGAAMTAASASSPWTERDGEMYLKPVDGPEIKITVRERLRWSEGDEDFYEMVAPDGRGTLIKVRSIEGHRLASLEDVYAAAERHLSRNPGTEVA